MEISFNNAAVARIVCVLLLTSAVPLTFVGCSGSGPQTYELSGTVTHQGKPVPVGRVTMRPDSEQGNAGPGSVAEIKEGKFTTPAGKGVVGGPYVLRIVGFDGVPVEGGEGMDPTGTALFPPYEMKVDLPKENSTQDITVP